MSHASLRSCTKSSRHITAAIAMCVAIIRRRFGSRSTTSPPSGAARLTIANTKKTSPAALDDPVSTFIQTARTMIIAQSPNIESVCPAKRRRTSGRERIARTGPLAAEDAEVAADGLAAHDERRPFAVVEARIAAERNLGRKIARHRTGIHVELRAGCDADLDVAGHALDVDAPLAHGVDAHVAGHALGDHRAGNVRGVDIARDGLDAQLSVDSVEAGVAADRLDLSVAFDFSEVGEITRGRLHVEHHDAPAHRHVGGRRRELDAARVRHACAHAERRAAEAEVADRDRDAERLLAFHLDDDAAAFLPHFRQLDELLVALELDGRLFTVDRLDDDVAARHLDLELNRLGRVEALLCHLRQPSGSQGYAASGTG